jgi:hypothetical protein
MEDRPEALRQMLADLEDVRSNLWPDAYAGGGTVDRLARIVQRLVKLIEEKETA